MAIVLFSNLFWPALTSFLISSWGPYVAFRCFQPVSDHSCSQLSLCSTAGSLRPIKILCSVFRTVPVLHTTTSFASSSVMRMRRAADSYSQICLSTASVTEHGPPPPPFACHHLLQQLIFVFFVFKSFVWFSVQTAIVFLISINQLIQIVKCCVLFTIWTEFLNVTEIFKKAASKLRHGLLVIPNLNELSSPQRAQGLGPRWNSERSTHTPTAASSQIYG
jgi:hypothetical protein